MGRDDDRRRSGRPDNLDDLLEQRLRARAARIEERLANQREGIVRSKATAPMKPRFGAPTDPGAEHRWAVIVGINGGADYGLSWCKSDARAVHGALAAGCGYPPDHVQLLTDDAALAPTRRNIVGVLGAWLSKRQDADTILFYFSGHGAHGPDGHDYLVPVDAVGEPAGSDVHGRLISVQATHELLRASGAGRIVMVVDACRSPMRRRAEGGPRPPEGPGIGVQAAASAASHGVVYMQSCRADEYSLEDPSIGGGVYTHYLIRGLNGEADADGSGLVMLSELQRYLVERVPAHTDGRQHPQIAMAGDAIEDFVVSAPE